MNSLPDDLREVPFHTMLCPDDCPLCAGADEIERLRNLESICSGIAYARTAMNDKAVKIGLNKIDSYFAALKENNDG